MSSLIYIDDDQVEIKDGKVSAPTGKVLGLRDMDLTPEQREMLADREEEDEKELLRQAWYVLNTLTDQEAVSYNNMDETAKVKFLFGLVALCKDLQRDMKPWPVDTGKRVTTAAERLAEMTGLLSVGLLRAANSRTTGILDTTQRLDTMEEIKKSLAKQATEKETGKTKVSEEEDAREILNITSELWQHPFEKNLYLLPLGKEIPEIYQGPDKLPKYMLLTLQEYWSKKDEAVPLITYKEGGDMIRWADMVMLTIARAIQDIPTKKQKLWLHIAQNTKVLDALPDIERYVRNPKISFIRLCYEVRKGLSQDSTRADLQDEYGQARQKVSETPVIFIDRVNRLRQMAYGTGTDDLEEPTYENSWHQHYEVCTRGLINKQLMSEVHRSNPTTQSGLREAVKAADMWLRRSVKQGLVPGQVDPRALTGLTPSTGIAVMRSPGSDSSKQCNHCKKPGHTEDTCWFLHRNLIKCFNCNKVGHMRKQCTGKPQVKTEKGGNIQHLAENAGSGELSMEDLHCPVFQAGSQQ